MSSNKKLFSSSWVFGISLGLACSTGVVFAGSIADTYTTGDTLTATNMTNIKTAVNDNDTRMPGIEFNNANVFASLTGTSAAIVTLNVTAPTSGFLYVNAFGNISCDVANGSRVVLRNNTDSVEGTYFVHSHNANEYHRYSVSAVFPVTAGTKAIQALSRCTGGTAGGINVESFSAIFIPRRL